MESTESRFAHLLQPIRELTKNWDVDVASELNDYLEELDEMCITFDGGKTRLNFAEAALLIQGSTCIYSKKVEMLHNLVYQTLEYINDRNKKRNKEVAVSQEDGGAASGRDDGDDDEAVFTPLDIDASDNLDMSESNAKVTVVPLPPESLIPPETHEKRRLPLISLKGEILCSLKDFRMNQFMPADNNMIILRLCPASSNFDHRAELQEQQEQQQQQEGRDAAATDAVADADPSVENFLPLDDVGMEVEQEVEERVERQQAQSDGWLLRERRQAEAAQEKREEKAPPPVSVWTLHDAYAQLGGDKPFQAGKSYKVPEGLDEGGKRKRKRHRVLQDFSSWFRGAFDPPQHKLKNGPTFTDLNYVYFTTMKDKLKSRRKICRKAGVVISDEELRRTFLQPEEAALDQQGEEPLDAFRHPELLDGDDSDTEREVFGDDEVAAPDGVSPEAQPDELTYEDLVKLRVEQLVVNSRGYTQETALSRRVKDWEDKIRPELLQQEERPPFDIHDYGDRIVSALSSVGRRRTFASIVSGLDNFEACKFLLASLQLANDYTVEVESPTAEGLEERLDSMSLTLLSTHRAADRFKQLKASS